VLGEHVTPVMLAGIPLTLVGCWFAAGAGRRTGPPADGANGTAGTDGAGGGEGDPAAEALAIP
jgi:hypothetical protein